VLRLLIDLGPAWLGVVTNYGVATVKCAEKQNVIVIFNQEVHSVKLIFSGALEKHTI